MVTDMMRKWIMTTLWGKAETDAARSQEQHISLEELTALDEAAQRQAMFHDPAELEPTPEDLAQKGQEQQADTAPTQQTGGWFSGGMDHDHDGGMDY